MAESYTDVINELRRRAKAGETLTAVEKLALSFADAHDIAYPPENPDEEWTVETIEYVTGAMYNGIVAVNDGVPYKPEFPE